jgi:hypothetical protein
MTYGFDGSTLVDELNRLANGGADYPARDTYQDAQGAANKWTFNKSVHVATTIPLTSGVYAAGSIGADGGTGVGATYTANVNGTFTIDGHTLSVGENILIWKQSNAKVNGIYTVTNAGSVSTKWVFTRSTNYNNGAYPSQVSKGGWFRVITGATNAGKYFSMTATGTGFGGGIIIGTDNIDFTEISTPVNISGIGLIGALNKKVLYSRSAADYKGLNAVCNELAGTTGLEAIPALREVAS